MRLEKIQYDEIKLEYLKNVNKGQLKNRKYYHRAYFQHQFCAQAPLDFEISYSSPHGLYNQHRILLI